GVVAEQADLHVVLADVFHRRAAADLRQEGGAVDQRAVGIGVHEVRGEMLVEPGHVGLVDRAHVVVVEVGQGREMLLVHRGFLPSKYSVNSSSELVQPASCDRQDRAVAKSFCLNLTSVASSRSLKRTVTSVGCVMLPLARSQAWVKTRRSGSRI